MDKIKICIMAGGAGTRFWPLSTEERPKQFIDILKNGQTLLQATFGRAKRLTSAENIFVLTHVKYKELVSEQLPEVNNEHILCETERKNTAAALACATMALQKSDADDFLMVVLSADHIIQHDEVFADTLIKACALASKYPMHLFPLGIRPSVAHTGYGYLKVEPEGDLLKVRQFKEKPDLETATAYLKSGHYLWNSGIFVWHIRAIAAAFQIYAPDIWATFLNNPAEDAFLQVRSESIDYAIMEKSDHIYTLACEFGWDDLGTYSSLYQMSQQDESNNVKLGGQSRIEDTTETIVILPEGTEAIIRGLKDYIVCLDNGKLLIYPKSEEQSLKSSLAKLLSGEL
jgi:mannose-1-phosphate guanylyltransferase